MTAIVEVKLQLGHRAKVRDVVSPKGHTHDWVVFVKGSDKIELEHFVEKVVFWLHESYEPNRKIIKHPPYRVSQSGFAGFNMLIDVHFRNREEPKMVRFQYDLFLHTEEMPPVNHTRLEKLTFTNPTEDFRLKLISAGALLINTNSSRPLKDQSDQNAVNSKKERKLREGSSSKETTSSHYRHRDEKKASSMHYGKKDVRLPNKDMKKHVAAKHQKFSSDFVGKAKECPRDKNMADWEVTNKKIPVTEEGYKKKKKKSYDSSSPIDHAKSFNISSQMSIRRDRAKKIQSKADVMAGLFAPENSINMAQIKQSKEKAKQELNKVKKEARSVTDITTGKRSASPNSKLDEINCAHSSKTSPTGGITLKILKERIDDAENEKMESKLHEVSKFKKEPREKMGKRSKISPVKGKKRKREKEPTRKISISSDSSPVEKITSVKKDKWEVRHHTRPADLKRESHHKEIKRSSKAKNKERGVKSHSGTAHCASNSSNGSDMDISSDEYSSSEKAMAHTNYLSPKPKREAAESIETKPKFFSANRDGPKMLEKYAIDASPKIKVEKVPSERDQSLAISAMMETQENSVLKRAEKNSSFGKTKKIFKAENCQDSAESQSHKSKKTKRSAKEKSIKHFSKGHKIPTRVSYKMEKRGSTPNSTISVECPSIKKGSKRPSTSLYHASVSPTKIIKLEKSADMPSKEKQKSIRKQSLVAVKSKVLSNKKQLVKVVPQSEEKLQTVFESSFVETDNSGDSDNNLPNIKADIKKKLSGSERSQKGSSAFSQPTSCFVQSQPLENSQAYCYASKHLSLASSSSASSGDEEIAMSEIPPSTSTMNIISPIRDSSHSLAKNTPGMVTAYNDMEMSDSNSSSNSGLSPMQSASYEQHSSVMRQLDSPESSKNMRIYGDAFSSSLDEKDSQFSEKPIHVKNPNRHVQESPEPYDPVHEHMKNPNRHAQEFPEPYDPSNVVILAGQDRNYPHMTESLYCELQDLQKRIFYITDVSRLKKIARIVAKSQKLLRNEDYFDFDLCSLDNRTIHKIQKHLKTV